MDQCPCEMCIALAMCRIRCQENAIKFLLNVRYDCHEFADYVIKGVKDYQVMLNDDHAIEAGRHLGYTISRGGPNRMVIKVENPPSNPNGTFRRENVKSGNNN